MLRQRQPRVRDREYLGWLAKGICVACYITKGVFERRVICAHLRMPSAEHGKRETGGAEKPSDRWCTPLCDDHHRDNSPIGQHRIGERKFWENLKVDPFALCLALSAAYDRGEASAASIVVSFCKDARKARSANGWGF